jgi:hypothetical protein
VVIGRMFIDCALNKVSKSPKFHPIGHDMKRYSPVAKMLVAGVQGGGLGLTPALVFKGLGGATPAVIKGLPPIMKAAGLASMATGGYIIVEVAKLGG